MKRLEADVLGRVQGVGFRYFVMTRARNLGVSGFVRNEPDGSVRVVAEGGAPALEQLERALRTGPRGAQVSEVRISHGEGEGGFSDFDIAR